MSEGRDVTVVVVGYNHAAFIEKCLDSITEQTLQPARVLVMDDHSPDRTAEVARAWASRTGYPLEVVRNAQNMGLCATLNEALATITTPFYAYISADDHMEPERFERQVAVLAEAPEDVAAVYSDAFIEDGDGRRTGELASEHFGWPPVLRGSQAVFGQLLEHNWIPAPSVLLRTAAVKGIGGYDPDLYFEDLDLWLRLLQAGHAFLCVEEPLVTFRVHAASLGSSTFEEENPRFIEAQRRILAKQLTHGTSEQRARIGRTMWWLAVRSARIGRVSPDVVRDLIILRRHSDLGWPWRAIATALFRGMVTRMNQIVRRAVGRP